MKTRHILIATGSESTPLPGIAIDEQRIVSSTGGLSLPSVPKRLVVIGGGYIGLEMGSVWRRLGSEVTVVEFLDRILPGMDGEVSKVMQRLLQKQGIAFKLGTKVTAAVPSETGVIVTLEPAKGGASETLAADVVLVAVGRRPYVEGLGLEAVRRRAATSAAGSRPTGITPPMSRASMPSAMPSPGPCWPIRRRMRASRVAEILAGQAGHVNYDAIPGVVYTWPEAASVGQTEEQLKAADIAYKVGKFPFTANGRARAMAMTDGFVKILADQATDRILGAHIVGPEAGDLIAEIGAGDGVRRRGRRHRAHLPRPSDLERGRQGSRARRRRPRDPYLIDAVAARPHHLPGHAPRKRASRACESSRSRSNYVGRKDEPSSHDRAARAAAGVCHVDRGDRHAAAEFRLCRADADLHRRLGNQQYRGRLDRRHLRLRLYGGRPCPDEPDGPP